MSVLIKICGLKTVESLDAALDAGADMVGFVFFPPSPRHLGFEAARTLSERVRGRVKKVALSVDVGNVAEALRITRAPSVDVSSGVEREPGEKDPDKIRAFIRAARAAVGHGARRVARHP